MGLQSQIEQNILSAMHYQTYIYIYIVWGWGAASYPRVLGEEYNTSSTMMDSTVETTPALVPMLDSFDNCGFLAKLWPLRFGHIFG